MSAPRRTPDAWAALPLPGGDTQLWLGWTARGLCMARFGEPGATPDGPSAPEQPLPAAYAAVRRYLAGQPVDLAALAVDVVGTPFQLRVWEALRRIPYGQVRSYAAVAADIGAPRGMRAVGAANARNPLPVVIPCHRVVQSGYRLGGYSAGLHRKRLLLELEGVVVEGDRVEPGQLSFP